MDLSNFKLTYDDEFNSFTSSPDGSQGYQTTFYFGGRTLSSNSEQEYYSDPSVGADPFSLDHGALTITGAPGSNPAGLPYNSGLITTEGDFSQTYGYFEVRAEVPEGAGMWPGFWLLPADKSWPPEIDVLEAFGAQNATGLGGTNTYHVGAITSDWASGGGGEWVPTGVDTSTGYHTYGVDWEPDHVTYYFDGKQVMQFDTPSDMHKPMYMLANLAVGGNEGWAGSPAGETGQMHIDYIRAYSADPNAHAVAQQQVSSPDGTDTGGAVASGDSAGSSTDGTSHAATASDPGTGSNSVSLHVSEDAWVGDAQFVVTVDGHQVGGVQTATANHAAGQWQDVVVHGDFDNGPHTVGVTFVNDASGTQTGQDRNLFVQSVDVNGEHIAGNTAENSAAHGSEDMDPSAAVMVANGEADFHAAGSGDAAAGGTSGADSAGTGSADAGSAGAGSAGAGATGTGSLTLHVSEDAWNGDAQFVVTVDGQQVGGVQTATASHAAGQVQDVTLTGDFGSTGPGSVGVHFLNDAWGGSADTDRNLYVQGVDANGTHFDGNTASNDAANGYASVDPTASVMDVNGTTTFDVHHSAAADLLLS